MCKSLLQGQLPLYLCKLKYLIVDDLRISKTNSRYVFEIFHKPSYGDTKIHNTSVHPIQHKMVDCNNTILFVL